jgi:DNA-binding MarR family transcriptional regulator
VNDPSASKTRPHLSFDESWSYKLSVLSDLVARRVATIAAEVGDLNLSQWRVLAAIGDQDGRTASQVVEVTPMDKGIVSRAVASLISQNYLRRRASASDGRLSYLHMTASGRRLYDAILLELDRTGANGETVLSPDAREHFANLLDQITHEYRQVARN